jgi:histidine triad (HIT) family protein
MADDCIFCRIVAGDVPSTKVFENDAVIAIMDTSPWTKGHCLVIPRNHSANIFEITEADATEVIKAAKTIAAAIKTGLGADGLNLLQSNGHAAWQSVDHFHLHLIPRWFSDSLIPPVVPSEGNPESLARNAQVIVEALNRAAPQ